MSVCPKCNTLVNDDDHFCPNCGCNIYEENEKSRSSKHVRGTVIAIIIAAIILGAAKYAYDFGARENYKTKVETCAYTMLEGAKDAEDACNKIVAVWNNSIWGIEDSETDKYTIDKYGYFYDDFDDALDNLFSDDAFIEDLQDINENLQDVNARMKELQNPPKNCEQLHGVFMDFYDEYFVLVNCALNPSGSLNSYSDKFSEADEKSAQYYDKLIVYFE